MDRHTLDQGWQLTAVGGLHAVPDNLKPQLITGIPATVPGCVHTDLMAPGLLPDPYIGLNEREQYWIRHIDWRYSLRFDPPENMRNAQRLDLVCDGLDTIATLKINGQPLGEAANMFTPHRFDLRAVLRVTDNELHITFKSALQYAEQMRERIGALPHGGGSSDPQLPYNMVRKMACNFGWDWGPLLITAGLWKPARLEAWNTARIESVRPLITRADQNKAEINLHVDTRAATDETAKIAAKYELVSPGGKVVATGEQAVLAGETSSCAIHIDKPERWWPVGHGAQPLYTLRITLEDKNGQPIDRVEKRIGLRTAELATTDEQGNPTFHFKINGKRIFCKGANWIPDDCFPHRVTPQRYRQRITQARDANMNMLRVWGGGLYEADDFYDVCDELGILVWQDMLTACALYPEEPPFPKLFKDEVRHNIARLSSHPSLIFWNGGNECIWGAFDWGPEWEQARKQTQRGWGLGYWLDLFPRLMRELDPSRPYWANSPYSGSLDIHPNSEDVGNCHHWDVWNGHGEYDNYLTHRPLFASEFGFHGPPTWPTLDRSIPATDRAWDAPAVHHHNKQLGGQDRADRLIRAYFRLDTKHTFDDWLYLAQLNQARALKLGCEWFRSLSPRTSGALYWQLNDCWPVASWAAIDGDGRPKPLWFATKQFFRDHLITILPRDAGKTDSLTGPLAVCFHNDHDDVWTGDCRVRMVAFDGRTLHAHTQTVTIQPRGSHQFNLPDGFDARPDALIVAELKNERALHFFHRDKHTPYPKPDFTAKTEQSNGTTTLTITAKSLLRDLMIFPERLDPDATIDAQMLTLLPDESLTFTITTNKKLNARQLTTRPVLQVANHYGKSIG